MRRTHVATEPEAVDIWRQAVTCSGGGECKCPYCASCKLCYRGIYVACDYTT